MSFYAQAMIGVDRINASGTHIVIKTTFLNSPHFCVAVHIVEPVEVKQERTDHEDLHERV